MEIEHRVYRFFSKEGTLIYVSVTTSKSSRDLMQNMQKQWWGHLIHRHTIEIFPDRKKALEAKRDIIKSESPALNAKQGPKGPWKHKKEIGHTNAK